MPTSPKIPKETILEAALQILIRDGFTNVNIKTIAKELGCSTQPISWHLGNMENLRIALGQYAYEYADAKTTPTATNGLEAFTEVGDNLTNIAFDEPNLFRFLFLDGYGSYCLGGIEALTEMTENHDLIVIIARENGFSEAFAAEYMESMIIYTVGILTLCVSGVLKCSKEQVHNKIQSASERLLRDKSNES